MKWPLILRKTHDNEMHRVTMFYKTETRALHDGYKRDLEQLQRQHEQDLTDAAARHAAALQSARHEEVRACAKIVHRMPATCRPNHLREKILDALAARCRNIIEQETSKKNTEEDARQQ